MSDEETLVALSKAIRAVDEALRLTKQVEQDGLLNDEQREYLANKRDDVRRWISDLCEARNAVIDRIEV